MSKIKDRIKAILREVQHQRYQKELASQKVDYDSWIRGQEAPLLHHAFNSDKENRCLKIEIQTKSYEPDISNNEGKTSKNVRICRIGEAASPFQILEADVSTFMELLPAVQKGNVDEKVILVLINEGCISEFAWSLIYDAFCEDEKRTVVYGDEDVQIKGHREQPWLKPDWSPDTFLAGFYMGSMVALSTEKLHAFLKEKRDDEIASFYELLWGLIEENGGFDTWKEANKVVCHIPQVLYHTKECGYEKLMEWKLPVRERKEDTAGKQSALVSVIIPSKDHPDILFRCLDSFRQKTTGDINGDKSCKYEFIIVDNGSNDENRKRIEDKVFEMNNTDKRQQDGFQNCQYIYHASPFNFSKMCNLGADMASGDYFLFLNDDMEILQPDWLQRLLDKAELSYVGAVGAKLLYPETDVIQHAGITNLRVGPAHKLQFAHDSQNHYYGKNRGVHDVLGVTGACLLVSKAIFCQVDGFDENLAVAFNDVDLCYKIYEAGYYNVVRNDVILYHHESLSRGKDGESAEKQQRLLHEKDYLYAKHQKIYGMDPFYHPYFTTDMLETEYVPAYRYQVDLSMDYAKVHDCTREIASAREDKCLVVGMECAMDIYKWKYGVANNRHNLGYYFQGYAFVIGSDNACYERELLLKECIENGENKAKPKIYGVSVVTKYRADIREHLTDQLNVDLTGYASKLEERALPPGKYQFGMIARDKCSHLKLVNWSSWTIEIQ